MCCTLGANGDRGQQNLEEFRTLDMVVSSELPTLPTPPTLPYKQQNLEEFRTLDMVVSRGWLFSERESYILSCQLIYP